MKHTESKLQIACIRWFDLYYPKYKQLLFAIPNGGKRGIVTASIMKAEGVRAGVADLFLALPASFNDENLKKHQHNGLFIEMKTDKGTQSDSQKSFQKEVTDKGYGYEVIRSFDGFTELINNYIKNSFS